MSCFRPRLAKAQAKCATWCDVKPPIIRLAWFMRASHTICKQMEECFKAFLVAGACCRAEGDGHCLTGIICCSYDQRSTLGIVTTIIRILTGIICCSYDRKSTLGIVTTIIRNVWSSKMDRGDSATAPFVRPCLCLVHINPSVSSPNKNYTISSPNKNYTISSPNKNYTISSPNKNHTVSSPENVIKSYHIFSRKCKHGSELPSSFRIKDGPPVNWA